VGKGTPRLSPKKEEKTPGTDEITSISYPEGQGIKNKSTMKSTDENITNGTSHHQIGNCVKRAAEEAKHSCGRVYSGGARRGQRKLLDSGKKKGGTEEAKSWKKKESVGLRLIEKSQVHGQGSNRIEWNIRWGQMRSTGGKADTTDSGTKCR